MGKWCFGYNSTESAFSADISVEPEPRQPHDHVPNTFCSYTGRMPVGYRHCRHRGVAQSRILPSTVIVCFKSFHLPHCFQAGTDPCGWDPCICPSHPRHLPCHPPKPLPLTVPKSTCWWSFEHAAPCPWKPPSVSASFIWKLSCTRSLVLWR